MVNSWILSTPLLSDTQNVHSPALPVKNRLFPPSTTLPNTFCCSPERTIFCLIFNDLFRFGPLAVDVEEDVLEMIEDDRVMVDLMRRGRTDQGGKVRYHTSYVKPGVMTTNDQLTNYLQPKVSKSFLLLPLQLTQYPSPFQVSFPILHSHYYSRRHSQAYYFFLSLKIHCSHS